MRVLTTVLVVVVACLFSVSSTRAAEHPRLVSVEAARCTDCHDDLLAERTVTHAPAADDCTICHGFSLEEEGTTVALTDAEPALCLFCHDDKEAAVELELAAPHLPAADSCLSCHDPHASQLAGVLLAPVAELCGDCHARQDLTESHDGQLTAAASCASCHEPHGSDHERMLRASRLHAPFADGSCDGCHRQPFGERIRLRTRGERLCGACHAEFPASPGGSVHSALAGEHGRAGCLSCHDPHMSDQAGLLIRTGNELCGLCHQETVAAAGTATGHAPAGEDCLLCHLPHTAERPSLLMEAGSELCATCHDLAPSRPAAKPADATISGAGRESYGPATVVAAADYDNGTDRPELCTEPFPDGTWAGEIVLCQRGEVRRVLKSRNVAAGGAGGMILANRPDGASDLMADEHAIPAVHIAAADGGRLQAWMGEDPQRSAHLEAGRLTLASAAQPEPTPGDLVGAHLGADLGRLDCIACHSPHGAGQPKLLAANLHPPLEDGCDTCHEAGHDGLAEDGSSELCLYCHDDPAEGTTVPHGAMDLGACTDCHNAHASAQDKLVKEPGGGPCAECHDEQTAGDDEVAHGAIDLLGCRACHEPHGGRRQSLLRATGAELCLSCHAPRGAATVDGAPISTLLDHFELPANRVAAITSLSLSPDGMRNHPVDGHRVLGTATEQELASANVQTTFTGELTCLTCHDPHKGKTGKILRWGAASSFEACQACHIK